MVATKTLEKSKNVTVVYDFFKLFKTWFGRTAATPSVSELEKHFSKNFQLTNNGQVVARGAANYLPRLQKFQKKYSEFQISEPLEEPIISDNKVVLYYKLDLTSHTGQHKQIFIMGLFTIEDNKIGRWVEVSNDKASDHWDI